MGSVMMRSHWRTVSPDAMTGAPVRGTFRQKHTRDRPHRDRRRGWRDAATSPGMKSGAPKAGRGRKDPPPEPPEGAGPVTPGCPSCGTSLQLSQDTPVPSPQTPRPVARHQPVYYKQTITSLERLLHSSPATPPPRSPPRPQASSTKFWWICIPHTPGLVPGPQLQQPLRPCCQGMGSGWGPACGRTASGKLALAWIGHSHALTSVPCSPQRRWLCVSRGGRNK